MNNNDGGMIQPSITTADLKRLIKEYHDQLTAEAVEYLHERGINKKTIEKFEVGFEKDVIGFQVNNKYLGYFRDRIIFPIMDIDEITVDLVGRTINNSEPKFKSLLDKNDVFFNEPIVNHSDDLIFTNSFFDVLSLDQVKLPAVCLVNNQLTDNQIIKLTGKRVFLCFGNDEGGRRESIRVAKKIASVVSDINIIHLPEGFRDVNDFFIHINNPAQEFIKLLNLSLQENILPSASPDSRNLTIFQEEYIKRHKGNLNGIPTGFSELDSLLLGGLKEGLYLLSGDVSVGKTTFLKQLADQIADETPIIFVTWEMSSFELWTRSIARLSKYPLQAIMAGTIPISEIQKTNQSYAKIADNIWTVDAGIDTSLEDVGHYLEKIMKVINKKPVIILDYLQRIPLKKGLSLSTKEEQLQVVYNLHHWSRDFSIPILLATTGNEKEIQADLIAAVDIYMTLKGETKNHHQPVQLELHKNRNGTLGSIYFNFDRKIGIFSKMSENRN